jgi:hypothetical protein
MVQDSHEHHFAGVCPGRFGSTLNLASKGAKLANPPHASLRNSALAGPSSGRVPYELNLRRPLLFKRFSMANSANFTADILL